MPSPIVHTGAALACTRVALGGGWSWRAAALFVALANIADADLVPGVLLGGDPVRFHHHFTHSIVFALGLGLAGALFRWNGEDRGYRHRWAWLFAVALSHPLLDFFGYQDRGGPLNTEDGIALWWPFSEHRIPLVGGLFQGAFLSPDWREWLSWFNLRIFGFDLLAAGGLVGIAWIFTRKPARVAMGGAAAGLGALLLASWGFGAELPGPPTGYVAAEPPARSPVLALYTRSVWDGEVTISVERHPKQDGSPTVEAFLRQLGGKTAKRGELEVIEDVPLESFPRRISEEDPYAAELGSEDPPDLGFFERRTFPIGGEAYRLYRCRRHAAWELLEAYRKALEEGKAAAFAATELAGNRPGVVSGCFGKASLAAMRRGEAVEDVPKPSMAQLRLMAREEWSFGAVRRLERESLHVLDSADAITVVRYRAPERVYRRDEGDFLRLIGRLAGK